MDILASLTPIFKPKSVAVIGASTAPGKLGHDILANLKNGGFPGALYPINPKADEILGLKVYKGISGYPGGPGSGGGGDSRPDRRRDPFAVRRKGGEGAPSSSPAALPRPAPTGSAFRTNWPRLSARPGCGSSAPTVRGSICPMN